MDKVQIARKVLKDMHIDFQLYLEEIDEDLIINAMLVFLEKVKEKEKSE